MQNRFGLKDFVLMVLVLLVGLSVWLNMVQEDRRFRNVQDLMGKLTDVEKMSARQAETLARIDQGLARLLESVETSAAPDRGGAVIRHVSWQPEAKQPAEKPKLKLKPKERDESWARKDVPIEWQPAWGFVTDPRQKAGYAPGGEFTEVFEAQPAKLTPFIQTDVYGRRVVDLVSESLGAYDPVTLKLRGELAEAWQYDPNGMWLRVRIRPNARFSDGQPVTAEDVRWSFHDFVMNSQIEAERARSILADVIDRITVIDDRTVEFAFKGAFFSNLDSALTLNVLPKHFYSKFSPAEINKATGLLMGSGPYKLRSLDPDRQWAPPAAVELVRNEQFWGTPSPLERIRFKAINDELARLTEYKTGEADMITPSSPQFVSATSDPEWVKNNQSLNWVNMRSGRSGIIWNCGPRNGKNTPFHDTRVRLAMTMMIDREKMIRDIWKGIGVVAVGFFNPGTMGNDPAVKAWPFDPERARALLKEAGWEDRDGNRVLEDAAGNEFVFELTYFGGGEIAERLAKFIVDACAAAGIRCTLRQMDWSVGEPVRQQRDFDAMLMGWGANAPESDPKQIFHSESIKNQGDNFAQWSNPDADKAIDEARKELDPVKREALWRKFAAAMHEDQPYTWVRVAPFVRFVKPDVGNVNMYPKGLELWEFFRGGAAAPQAGM